MTVYDKKTLVDLLRWLTDLPDYVSLAADGRRDRNGFLIMGTDAAIELLAELVQERIDSLKKER